MSRSLDTLSPVVRVQVNDFLKRAAVDGIDLLVTCTSRTMDEQAVLYAQGRTTPGRIVTNAKPGESAHNFGLAIDVVPMVGGKPVWNAADPLWGRLGDLGELAGLEWAGRWVRFKEKPHFQMPRWRDHL